MRSVAAVVALTLTLALPSALAAEVIVRPHDPAAAEPAFQSAFEALFAVKAGLDEPATFLIVPRYAVETTDPSGTSTLFAVRNVTAAPLDLDVRYRSPDGATLRQDLPTLGARATLTRNVRDVAGLPVDPDGFARGFVQIQAATPFVGDYLQVDAAGDFATGDRMISLADLCDLAEIRFFDFGSGTELHFVVNVPGGTDPEDPPTFTVTPFGEDGAAFPALDVFVDEFTFTMTAADFTLLAFGTLVFDFGAASGGAVHGEYSAFGQFSVGMNGACRTP